MISFVVSSLIYLFTLLAINIYAGIDNILIKIICSLLVIAFWMQSFIDTFYEKKAKND